MNRDIGHRFEHSFELISQTRSPVRLNASKVVFLALNLLLHKRVVQETIIGKFLRSLYVGKMTEYLFLTAIDIDQYDR
jgi:hypothetical protein